MPPVAEIAVSVAKVVGESAKKTAEAVAEAAKEMAEKAKEIHKGTGPIVMQPNHELIKSKSLEALRQSNLEKGHTALENTEANEKVGLTEDDKKYIKEETGWSDEIVETIKSMDQYEIYKNAELYEGEIDGRKCLLKKIDMDYVDPKTGLTNRELMEKGRSPIDSKTGEKLELHHMGQNFDSPFAELTENTEHGDGNHSILHDMKSESWRQDPEKSKQYNNVQRPNHWRERAKEA